MTRRFRAALLTLLLVIAPAAAQEPLGLMIDRSIKRAETQALILAKNLQDKKGALPRTWENGELKTTNYAGWISGFFPGTLWMLYEQTGNEELRSYAEMFTDRVEPAKKITTNH